MKRLSVVFSFRNEEAVLDELLARLHEVLDPTGLDLEFIFVNDDSTDRSVEILKEHMETDPAIRVINMSSRFGVNPCFLAGMRASTGDAVITMDTDLQDPPEVIPELLAKWEEGCDVVHTTRLEREGESWVKLFVTRTAYRLISWFSEVKFPVDSGMFKLLSRRAVDVVTNLDEVDMYLRGVMTWVGFRQDQVFYKRAGRHAGLEHFPLTGKNPWLVFVRALFSFSRVPIAAIFFTGLVLTLLGAAGAVVVPALAALSVPVTFAHWAVAVAVLLGGLNLGALGVVGIYVSRAYNQVKGRPEYVIESTLGFETGQRGGAPRRRPAELDAQR